MFNAKITETDETLNPYKLSSPATETSDFIYAALESATAQKVTYWIGVPSISYQIRPKIMISRQDIAPWGESMKIQRFATYPFFWVFMKLIKVTFDFRRTKLYAYFIPDMTEVMDIA